MSLDSGDVATSSTTEITGQGFTVETSKVNDPTSTEHGQERVGIVNLDQPILAVDGVEFHGGLTPEEIAAERLAGPSDNGDADQARLDLDDRLKVHRIPNPTEDIHAFNGRLPHVGTFASNNSILAFVDREGVMRITPNTRRGRESLVAAGYSEGAFPVPFSNQEVPQNQRFAAEFRDMAAEGKRIFQAEQEEDMRRQMTEKAAQQASPRIHEGVVHLAGSNAPSREI